MRIRIGRSHKFNNIVPVKSSSSWYFCNDIVSRINSPRPLDIWFNGDKPVMLISTVGNTSVYVRYIPKYSVWYDKPCSLRDLSKIKWAIVGHSLSIWASGNIYHTLKDFTTHIHESRYDRVAVFNRIK